MELTQYSIVLVNLDPTFGSEIQKTRPCVIVSPDEMNRHLKTVVICPMTTNLKDYPTRILVNQGGKKGMIIVDQIRTVDKSRVLKVFEKLNVLEIKKLKNVIEAVFVK
jgi:mRNA interferase MazF